jgi:hypothetical protein
MIQARRLIVDASFAGLMASPIRVSRVRIEGLTIHTPPKNAGGSGTGSVSGGHGDSQARFLLDEVVADSSELITTPSDPSKDPLVFHIHSLVLRSVGVGSPMKFRAQVENAKPPGLVVSEGQFGPWNAEQPGDTALSGRYTFRNADLDVFKGTAGTLSSDGQYRGELDRLEVHGTADVPNFSLDTAGRPMHLATVFDATVDGTNGDTVLHPVRARLGGASFEVSGAIARGALEKHKTIELDARCCGAPLDDFLLLTVKGPKPMTGRISFSTKVRIPPGEVSVADRIQLDGTFALSGVRFTSADVQGKIAGLSHRAQGDPENHDPNVATEFRGAFHLRDGQLGLPKLTFDLPGADITMTGAYGLRSGALDFDGTARLDATVSQMTTGVKSVLLKAVDPLLRRDGAGAVVPIHIGGTRGQPSFSLDVGRVIRRK